MAISEKKMQIVIDNYFKSECDVNTNIRQAFEKGFRIGVMKGQCSQPSVENKCFDGMNNGEVIQALFPKAKIFENESNVEYSYVDVFLYSENDMNCYKKDWWNAPYQKGGE